MDILLKRQQKILGRYVLALMSLMLPPQAAVPAGGTPAAPAQYGLEQLAKPFTLVFDQSGKYVAYNSAMCAAHYGNPTVLAPEPDPITTLAVSGTLPVLTNNDLKVNGIPIELG